MFPFSSRRAPALLCLWWCICVWGGCWCRCHILRIPRYLYRCFMERLFRIFFLFFWPGPFLLTVPPFRGGVAKTTVPLFDPPFLDSPPPFVDSLVAIVSFRGLWLAYRRDLESSLNDRVCCVALISQEVVRRRPFAKLPFALPSLFPTKPSRGLTFLNPLPFSHPGFQKFDLQCRGESTGPWP